MIRILPSGSVLCDWASLLLSTCCCRHLRKPMKLKELSLRQSVSMLLIGLVLVFWSVLMFATGVVGW